MNKKLYEPFPSELKNKKFSVYVINEKTNRPKLIHFGDSRYQDYKQHRDEKKRQNYRRRAEKILLKDGTPAYKNKNQPAYWSYNFLW